MVENEEIREINIEGRTNICPVCGYKDGFHVSFDVLENGKTSIILICPECHAWFDPGWKIQMRQF
jgi:hypothetical protein